MKPKFHKVYGRRDPSKERMKIQEFLMERPLSYHPFDLGKPYHVLAEPSFAEKVSAAMDVHRTKVWASPEYLYLGRKEKMSLELYIEDFKYCLPAGVANREKPREFMGMTIVFVDEMDFMRVGL